ncbi:hypothetical protein HGO40_11170 [Pseudomonas sp. CG7]|uniref:hypothetical protein n=1 Tax=Pseudomonas sp. CG7 TaxID=191007 RepID=UPI002033F054|nr:hypothetical protein [Pseudomonas sp. CG7]MCM2461040.1 hypothetical protein [Pseudomonas sp. CG7]
MSQEAKIIALEHLVVRLMKELQVKSGISSNIIFEKARTEILTSNYPGDPERQEAAKGALEDLAALIG